jgi:lysophospholipase L1-like esterase
MSSARPVPDIQRSSALPLWKQNLFLLVALFLMVVLAEGLGQIYYRLRSPTHRWQFAEYFEKRAIQCFEPHPYLVIAPIPGKSIEYEGIKISHNSLGFRGPEITREAPPGVTRIVTLGGSSTYCVKLSNQDTWPVVLEQKLGSGFQVVNLGVPGYSTAEHVIQAAFWLSDLKPAIVVCYAGWNDVQNLHIRNLAPDYSDYHSRVPADTLDVIPVNRIKTPFALARLSHGACFRLSGRKPLAPVPDEKAFTSDMDPRALSLYERNLRSIAALCHSQNIKLLLVPQLVNPSALTNETAYGWVPLVRDKDLPGAIGTFNETMRMVAHEAGVPFAARVTPAAFQAADFLDQGHFSPQGSEKFAGLLREELQAILPAYRSDK